MFLVEIKLQKTKFSLALMVLAFLLAAPVDLLAAQRLILEKSLNNHPSEKPPVTPVLAVQQAPLNTAPLNQAPEDDIAIIWPMLPNESVTSLAQLFYPKNKKMQQLFIAKTLQLSREIQPKLKPAAVSNQASLIVIPNIKLLAKQAGSIKSMQTNNAKFKLVATQKLHLSYSLQGIVNFVISPKMQADYENLVKRNEFLKQELEKLNQKLVHLQELLTALKAEAIRILSRPAIKDTATTNQQQNISLLPRPKPISKLQASPQPELVKEVADVHLVSKAQFDVEQSVTKVVKPALKNLAFTNPILLNSKPPSSISQYLTLPISAMVLVIAVIIGFISYARKQAKKLYLASAGSFDPLKSGIFTNLDDLVAKQGKALHKLDFSLTQSEYSGVMSVTDLTDSGQPSYTEESDLVLEQARIYININRVHEATELLRAQIKAMPQASLHHWLYLLDIYRDNDQKDEFSHYAKLLHNTFNVMIPLWENTLLPIVIAESLEEFPHIMSKLTALWAVNTNDSETRAYLDELMTDNRNKERTGFSMEAFQEIILLRDILTLREKLADIWLLNNYLTMC